MAKRYIVESVFIHNGLKCVAVLNYNGFRCGYVGVPKDHPFYGCEHELVNDWVSVHGGLTFDTHVNNNSSYPLEVTEDMWWFGFDCGHAWDISDYDSVVTQMPEHTTYILRLRDLDSRYPTSDHHIWTLQDVEDECRNLARQLAIDIYEMDRDFEIEDGRTFMCFIGEENRQI